MASSPSLELHHTIFSKKTRVENTDAPPMIPTVFPGLSRVLDRGLLLRPEDFLDSRIFRDSSVVEVEIEDSRRSSGGLDLAKHRLILLLVLPARSGEQVAPVALRYMVKVKLPSNISASRVLKTDQAIAQLKHSSK
ncbi:hypothetical protein CRG98_003868 [Punica granatum]|uniref:Uncharacterized protein n=1 Tax=Punica granatum TaxID=22663 RepID=A0A2I0L4U3_PUNGR|nr:hypothetical protein CRG98_003868 [Punica granatum]